MTIRIHPVRTATAHVSVRPAKDARTGRSSSDTASVGNEISFPVLAWIVEHPEGVIVVDTGVSRGDHGVEYFPEGRLLSDRVLRFDIGPGEEISAQLSDRGIHSKDVRWVVLTHLHIDHAGGVHHFPDSEILLAEAELLAARGAEHRRQGYVPERWPSWFAPRTVRWPDAPYGPFPHHVSLTQAGDVHLVPTPGHSAGHLSVIIEGSDGYLVCLAGDVTPTEAALLQWEVPVQEGNGHPSKGSAAETVSIERLRLLGRQRPLIYLPSHDQGAAQRLSRRQALP